MQVVKKWNTAWARLSMCIEHLIHVSPNHRHICSRNSSDSFDIVKSGLLPGNLSAASGVTVLNLMVKGRISALRVTSSSWVQEPAELLVLWQPSRSDAQFNYHGTLDMGKVPSCDGLDQILPLYSASHVSL